MKHKYESDLSMFYSYQLLRAITNPQAAARKLGKVKSDPNCTNQTYVELWVLGTKAAVKPARSS